VIPQEHMRMAKAQWERNWKYAVDGKHHLESFALVNGSVFSIWHHMRKATNPNFDPDAPEPKHGRRSLVQPQANVKIQLLTTSDGKRMGGIRLNSTRPRVHRKQPWHEKCNKRLYLRARGHNPGNAEHVMCRKGACIVDGYSEVDKLRKSIGAETRKPVSLTGDDEDSD